MKELIKNGVKNIVKLADELGMFCWKVTKTKKGILGLVLILFCAQLLVQWFAYVTGKNPTFIKNMQDFIMYVPLTISLKVGLISIAGKLWKSQKLNSNPEIIEDNPVHNKLPQTKFLKNELLFTHENIKKEQEINK